MWFGIVFGWIAWSLVNAAIAGQKNRSEARIFCLSILVSPLLASFYIIAVPPLPKKEPAPVRFPQPRADLIRANRQGAKRLLETNLKGANLSSAAHLTREKVLSSRDWRGAQLPPDLKELEIPENAPEEAMDHLGRTWPKGVVLRESYQDDKTLTRERLLSARDWRGAKLPPDLKDLELPWEAPEEAMDRLRRTWQPDTAGW